MSDAEDEDQFDLTAFDGGSELRKPFLIPDEEVEMRFPDKGEVVVGVRGPIPLREDYGFVKYVNRQRHWLWKKDAYACSIKLLKRLRAFGCVRILVAEQRTGTVFEYHRRQFDEGPLVPKHLNPNHGQDDQRYVPTQAAWGVFEEHADKVVREFDGL